MIPRCPICAVEAESVTRYIGGSPAFIDQCGHFVRVHGNPLVLEAHPDYGDEVRESELVGDWATLWRLSAGRNGKAPAVDPPLWWMLAQRKTARASA